ncbi:MAG: SBBP repeat-containing protein, partial [Thermoproteota archaeon]
NDNVKIKAEEELTGRVNYIKGNDPKRWKTNIATYGRIRYEELYPGIDLVFYGNQKQLEYDLVLKPGKEYKPVAFLIEGAKEVKKTEEGDLKIVLESGSSIVHKKPTIYQEIDGKKKQIEGSFELRMDEKLYIYAFNIGEFDRTRPLIIDPLVISYSTYLGGTGFDYGLAIAVDSSGNVYVTGYTTSSDFPTKNAYDGELGGREDAFVAKFDLTQSGSASLLYSTYSGGSGYD